MNYRALGRTGLKVSEIGFGCGNVGGLMIRGEHADQVKAVARAMELGINYFDTASQYGDGQSESNLGRVLLPSCSKQRLNQMSGSWKVWMTRRRRAAW